MAVIHISQEEAERDFASVLKRLDANTSFVIEKNSRTVATVKPVMDASLSATIARLKEHSRAYVDDGFAADVQEAIDLHREPFDLSILE